MRAKSLASPCVIVVILVGLLAGIAFAEKAITRVDVTNKADRVIISVKGNAPLGMSTIKSQQGKYVGFQFPMKTTQKARRVSVRNGWLHNVRFGNYKPYPPTTRIVANTKSYVDMSTQWSQDRTQVDIVLWKMGVVKQMTVEQALKAAAPVVKVAASVETVGEPVYTAPAQPAIPEVKTAAEPAPKRIVRATGQDSGPKYYAPGDRRVSVNFLGADINDVLKALSVQSGHNIVSGKDVTGTVTVSLSDVELEDALTYVAKLSGYGYANDNGTYLVGTRDSIRAVSSSTSPTASATEVVALRYAGSDDLIALLGQKYAEVQVSKAGVLSSGGKKTEVASAAGPNSMLVLSGATEAVAQASALIAQVEESMKNQLGEFVTEVYHIKYVSATELASAMRALVPDATVTLAPADGFDLYAPEAVAGAGGDTSGGATVSHSKVEKKADEIGWTQSIIVTGNETAVKRALDLASKLDVKAPQIKIEAKVTSLTETGEKKLGLAWEWDKIAFVETGTEAWKRSAVGFAATLDALVKNGDGKLLAAPNLVCVEGKPGIFFVGDEVRYIVRIETTQTGQNIITETANVGVQLRVVGDASPDGNITLNLHPEVSVLQLQENRTANITLPIITRRFTDHVVRVKNGQTIVIGGLIRDDEIDTMSKVPLLGDLPILGHLFRHREKTKDRSEVVMFITASLLDD